ncbi:hypothetical protein PHYC_00251 [Phycisphaerales bacterium]|nr:hypothetical protein PHYC_00251 [Phycisphaerales bacterium]
MKLSKFVVCSLCTLASASAARAQLQVGSSFNSGLSPVGLAYDQTSDTVWIYPSFSATIHHFSSSGAALGTVPRPGGSANDADLAVPTVGMSLNGTPIPAGTLLFIDGESGVAEIYAINPATGGVIASLNTSFGVSHVVGGAYHPGRETIFLVQDRVPGGSDANRVAEINPASGAVLNTWVITAVRPTFTVNFGDLDIAGNGNLLVASSDESSIGEFTPAGAFVAEHALPAGVSSLCGIGSDHTRCELWAASTGTSTWRMTLPAGHDLCGAPPCDPDVNCDGAVNGFDVEATEQAVNGDFSNFCQASADLNGDGAENGFDIETQEQRVNGAPC